MKGLIIMKRMISMLLILLMLTGSGCGEQPTSDNNSVETTAAVTETDTADPYPDNLPAELDYGGEEISFIYREEIADEFYIESFDGDVVHDNILSSMNSVEERLDVDIIVTLRPGHLIGAREEYMNHIDNSIMAGDRSYDWVDLMIGNAPLRAMSGNYMNLLENSMIDLDQPWYLSGLRNVCTVADQLFFVSGDASLGYLKSVFCMYFNKVLAEIYDIENLYQTVESGNWTLNKLTEVTKITSQDLNHDGTYSLKDQLGFVNHDNTHLNGYMFALGTNAYTKQSDGSWKFTFGSDRDYTAAAALGMLYSNTEGALFPNSANASSGGLSIYNQITANFCSDKIFLITAEMNDGISLFRSMESEYGVLPYPKLDENQENYITTGRSTWNSFSMPVTCVNPTAAGAVMEALSSSNYQKVLPSYFETTLKTKLSSDSEAAMMFDVIHDSMTLDFGYVFANAIGNISPQLASNMISNSDKIASFVAKNAESANKHLQSYVEDIEKMVNQLEGEES